MGTTTRLQLPYPEQTTANDVAQHLKDLAEAIAPYMAVDQQGRLSQRPAAGVSGRSWTVIGDPIPHNNGRRFRDNGSTWVELPRELPTAGDLLFASTNTPRAGYLLADGGSYFRDEYPVLWNLIATGKAPGYGAGNGTTTFTVPDYRDRFLSVAGTVRGSLGTFDGDDLGVPFHGHGIGGNEILANNILVSVGGDQQHHMQADSYETPGPSNVQVTFSHVDPAGTTDPRDAIPRYATVFVYVKAH